MLSITHLMYARCFRKALPVRNLLPSFRCTIATEGGFEWLPARLNSSKARLTEIRRRFGISGRYIMLLLWQRHCVCAISVRWQKRSRRERFYLHGEDYRDFKKAIRSAPG